MGHSAWNPSAYDYTQSQRAATGSSFSYSRAQSSRPVYEQKVHEDLDPKWRNSLGQQVRESRDSDEHPEAQAIGVIFDETGSMGEGPRTLQTKLGTLMQVLLRRGYVDHPQVLFGAVGDAHNGEVAPLQIGQFESGLEMDEQLDKIYLEGNGGGNGGETYGLALYFMARHTTIDCWTKRHQKGILVLIGDERPHTRVTRAEVERYIGDTIERDLTIEEVVQEVQEYYEVFFLHVDTGSARQQNSRAAWVKLLGERVIPLENLENVTETVAMITGLALGTIDSIDDAVDDLVQAGSNRQSATQAGQALAVYARGRTGAVATTSGRLPQPQQSDDQSGGSQRL